MCGVSVCVCANVSNFRNTLYLLFEDAYRSTSSSSLCSPPSHCENIFICRHSFLRALTCVTASLASTSKILYIVDFRYCCALHALSITVKLWSCSVHHIHKTSHLQWIILLFISLIFIFVRAIWCIQVHALTKWFRCKDEKSMMGDVMDDNECMCTVCSHRQQSFASVSINKKTKKKLLPRSTHIRLTI